MGHCRVLQSKEEDSALDVSTLLVEIASYPVKRVAIAAVRASRERVAEAVLVGDEAKIKKIAEGRKLQLDNLTVIDRKDDLDAAATAVGLVADGKADLAMKGYLHTDDFLRSVLDRERGLRTGVLMSHVFASELPGRTGFLFVTDGAMNIAPDLEQKAQTVLNAVHLAHALGQEEPRVAALAAVELLNPAMPATVDATCLHTMAERRQFSPRCLVDRRALRSGQRSYQGSGGAQGRYRARCRRGRHSRGAIPLHPAPPPAAPGWASWLRLPRRRHSVCCPCP